MIISILNVPFPMLTMINYNNELNVLIYVLNGKHVSYNKSNHTDSYCCSTTYTAHTGLRANY